MISLLPSPRYFPLHFHILSTLQTLCAQTGIYIPLSPYLLDILGSSEFRPTSTPRKSTLKPLDLEYVIRAPATYPRTRIYQETIGDELVYLLASYHAELVSSIAFPEIVLPVILLLKKQLKRASSGGKGKGMSPKVAQGLKGLVDKLEAQKKWSEEKRRNVGFAPRDRADVGRWEVQVQEEKEKTPLGMWVKTMRKVRDRKREEVEKALRGEE
jgi:nucleolar complex protein 2